MSAARMAITPRANRGGALRPVPTAVPPRGSSPRRGSTSSRRSRASSIWRAQPAASWPKVTGAASIRWVRPALTVRTWARASRRSSACRWSRAGISCRTIIQQAASRSADGNTSFDDWEALTSSLGCTGRPSRSEATWASTSLAFMLVLVPEPVWKTSSGKWSSNAPNDTSDAASWIAAATSLGITRRRPLTVAATPLIEPRAWISSGGTRSPEIGKFSMARCVCAPHRAATGTRTSPNESCSIRTSPSWSSGTGGGAAAGGTTATLRPGRARGIP